MRIFAGFLIRKCYKFAFYINSSHEDKQEVNTYSKAASTIVAWFKTAA